MPLTSSPESVLPELPDIIEGPVSLKLLTIVRDRIRIKLEHLHACGCAHELLSAKHIANPPTATKEQIHMVLCPDREKNPHCSHSAANLSPATFLKELEVLIPGPHMFYSKWYAMLDKARMNIRAIDLEAAYASRRNHGELFSLPLIQQQQNPSVEIVRAIGTELLSAVEKRITEWDTEIELPEPSDTLVKRVSKDTADIQLQRVGF